MGGKKLRDNVLTLTYNSLEKEIELLRAQLEEAEQHIIYQEEELSSFREVTQFFLNDFLTDLDKITSDDLEYALVKYQEKIDLSNVPDEHHQNAWKAVLKICKELGFVYPDRGYTVDQEIKIFIKTLARTSAILQKENVELAKKSNTLF